MILLVRLRALSNGDLPIYFTVGLVDEFRVGRIAHLSA